MNNSSQHNNFADRFIEQWKSGAQEFKAYTSGSTGKPKRILLPRKLMEESALRSIHHFQLDADSTIHLILSPEYIAGKMCIVRALMAGSKLTIESPSSHPLSGADIPQRITLLSAVGAQIDGMYELKEQGRLPSIEHLLLGGAPLSSVMASKALTLAENVWESYGMTETASHIALRKVQVKPLPFTPLDGISTEKDNRGCLVISMPTTGKIITNDIVELLPNGEFYVLGRADNVIISGGLKIIPEQVEQILGSHLPFSDFYISGRPHPKWGEQIILIAEDTKLDREKCIDAKDFEISPGKSLYQLGHELLKPYECPAAVCLLPKLSRTSTNKIIRKRIIK